QQDAVAWFGFYLLYRNAPERPATAASVSTAVARALPGTKIIRTLSIEQALAASWFLPRFRSLLAAGFFALALLIALFGIYAAVGEDLGRRRRELGIRGALGADPSRLAALAVSGVALAAAAGAAVGIGGAVWLSQLLQSAIHLSATSGASAYAAAAVLCWLAAVAVAAVAALPLVRRSPGDLLASR
ncbi:MAG: FtsX-like permease family protein, partial [Terriglobales bacterium]